METAENRTNDRISIDTNVHSLYRLLTEQSTKNRIDAPFFTMKDVFMWAVALGVRIGRTEQLSGQKTQIFRWDQFSQTTDIPVLKSLAISHTGDVTVVLNIPTIIDVAEQYANVGIHDLREELLGSPGQPLWNLVKLARTIPIPGENC